MEATWNLYLLLAVILLLWLGGVLTGLSQPLFLAAALLGFVLLASFLALLAKKRSSLRLDWAYAVLERGNEAVLQAKISASFFTSISYGIIHLPQHLAVTANSRSFLVSQQNHSQKLLIVKGTKSTQIALTGLFHGKIAPLKARLYCTDLFGFWRWEQPANWHPQKSELAVLPTLPPGSAGMPKTPAIAWTPSIFARPYAAGDELRNIHWKATAKAGTLMSRSQEAQPQPPQVLMIEAASFQAANLEQRENLVEAVLLEVNQALQAGTAVLIVHQANIYAPANLYAAQRALAGIEYAPQKISTSQRSTARLKVLTGAETATTSAEFVNSLKNQLQAANLVAPVVNQMPLKANLWREYQLVEVSK